MEPSQDFWPGDLTRPSGFWPGDDPTRSLSVVKQILDNGLIAVAVSVRPVGKTEPFSGLIYSITHTLYRRVTKMSESVLLE